MEKIKIVFLGNSHISLAALEPLMKDQRFKIIAVFTTIDQKIGRNHSKLLPSPVALFAKKNHLNLIKTANINKDIDKLKDLDFDLLVTLSFGQILAPEVLKLAKLINLNIHASLLPKGRGANPIQQAILEGEKETGFSLMEMIEEMDAGDYFYQAKIKIADDDTYLKLEEKIANLIKLKITDLLIKYVDQKLTRTKQEQNKVSYWGKISPSLQIIDFNKSTIEIYNKIRALNPKPKAKFIFKNIEIFVLEAKYKLLKKEQIKEKIGTFLKIEKEGIFFQTIDGIIIFTKIIIPGKKAQYVSEIVNGKSIFKN
ncbi:/ fmt / Methionyl-tRNA formyltransferase /:413000 Reverse [Candidatus Hepatoplasma crinochetorum]|uniref:methionyl-tRNA formyltransferase n=1 Tax=Candidatus Hepatoplasma crinochetorum TaxID=295596 RepID=A0A0G7ZL86_9MOLU|nr:/ fmt / Methionyl-tRNA formyltransferase /:413000 Reverse [Candidatus Hepatoplasma crinochetorum]